MINWRKGKAGFVGGSKRLIKGVFDFRYTVASEGVKPGYILGTISLNPALGGELTALPAISGEITIDNGD